MTKSKCIIIVWSIIIYLLSINFILELLEIKVIPFNIGEDIANTFEKRIGKRITNIFQAKNVNTFYHYCLIIL